MITLIIIVGARLNDVGSSGSPHGGEGVVGRSGVVAILRARLNATAPGQRGPEASIAAPGGGVPTCVSQHQRDDQLCLTHLHAISLVVVVSHPRDRRTEPPHRPERGRGIAVKEEEDPRQEGDARGDAEVFVQPAQKDLAQESGGLKRVGGHGAHHGAGLRWQHVPGRPGRAGQRGCGQCCCG